MNKTAMLLILGIALGMPHLYAQRTTDIEGSQDYPLLSRFDDAVIEYYHVTKWDSYPLPVYDDDISKPNYDNPLKLEGRVIRIQYSTTPDNNPAYVMKNYEKAFRDKGYTILLEGKPGEDFDQGGVFPFNYYGDYKNLNLNKFGFAYDPIGNHIAIIVAKGHQAGQDIYFAIVISDFSNVTLITQDVIEVEAAATGLVSAKDMAQSIAANGHVAVYGIHFDSGEAVVKPESAAALQNIATYLREHPEQQFLIVGHTDNTGDFAGNIKLSQARAEAVMQELIGKYEVEAAQLKAYGVGPAAPVASNSTAEGRAQNRRVEVVLQ
ncbi:MAG TPA: OmpA family protein [Flammeovirgaceae bacterium]|nr:OmpA family protein [Flammeovirgaceae bacterium]